MGMNIGLSVFKKLQKLSDTALPITTFESCAGRGFEAVYNDAEHNDADRPASGALMDTVEERAQCA